MQHSVFRLRGEAEQRILSVLLQCQYESKVTMHKLNTVIFKLLKHTWIKDLRVHLSHWKRTSLSETDCWKRGLSSWKQNYWWHNVNSIDPQCKQNLLGASTVIVKQHVSCIFNELHITVSEHTRSGEERLFAYGNSFTSQSCISPSLPPLRLLRGLTIYLVYYYDDFIFFFLPSVQKR